MSPFPPGHRARLVSARRCGATDLTGSEGFSATGSMFIASEDKAPSSACCVTTGSAAGAVAGTGSVTEQRPMKKMSIPPSISAPTLSSFLATLLISPAMECLPDSDLSSCRQEICWLRKPAAHAPSKIGTIFVVPASSTLRRSRHGVNHSSPVLAADQFRKVRAPLLLFADPPPIDRNAAAAGDGERVPERTPWSACATPGPAVGPDRAVIRADAPPRHGRTETGRPACRS